MPTETLAPASQSALNPALAEVTNALRQHSSVEECAALFRRTEAGAEEILAYIVPSGPFVPERLHSYLTGLAGANPNGPLPTAYVPLAFLPLTAEGTIDNAALMALPVCDEELLRRWETKLLSEPGITDAGVVVQDFAESIAPAHLADLLPEGEFSRAGDGVEVIEDGEEAKIRVAPVRKMSLSDGGPLIIPDDAPKTFTEAIHRTAALYPNKGVTYVNSDGSEIFQPFPALLEGAKRILTGLQKEGLKPGDRVMLQVEQLEIHFAAFWACVLGGFTPVTVAVAPTYAEKNGVVNKLYNTWELLEHPRIIASRHLMGPISGLNQMFEMPGLSVMAVEELKDNPPSEEIYPATPDDLIFFQLSSGSTGVPKCIQEKHAAIIRHIHGSAQFNGYTPDNVTMNWLAVDHVVPILTVHLKDVYLGCSEIHARTDLILSHPLQWLDIMDRHRVTHTWAPNFGFKLIADNLRHHTGRTWDLSCVEFWMNAAEQVTMPVVGEFLELTARYGVKPGNMQPSFGMAEACTCMTYANDFTMATGSRRFLKTSLSGDLIEAEPGDKSVTGFVDLGPPIPGVQIRITDTENKMVHEGVIGRFQIKGGVIMPGYLNNDTANKEAFVGDDWFNSGDMGYILDGRLTLTGREKEMIIVRGANFYCFEIEDVVNVVPGVESTFVGASAVEDRATGSEKLAIFFVPTSNNRAEQASVIKAVKTHVTASLGISPSFVVPLPKKDFGKTTSGKIQRTAMKKSLLAGQYDTILNEIDITLGNANTIPSWFYKPVWRRKEAVPSAKAHEAGATLIFRGAEGLSVHAELWPEGDKKPIRVTAGKEFVRLAPNRFVINPSSAADYHRLLATLNDENRPVTQVIHLWTYTPQSAETPAATEISDLNAAQTKGVYSLVHLVQALSQNQGPDYAVRMLVASTKAQPVAATDAVHFENAPLLGIIKTISQEMPHLDCRHIDLEGVSVADDAAFIARELAAHGDSEVAYRGGNRLISRLERVDLGDRPRHATPLKSGGTYLLTGGLGGIALEIARYLLKRYDANLLLVGRTSLPDRADWTKPQTNAVRERIEALQRLEALGNVRYEAADVADLVELTDAVSRAEAQWNRPLDGVFHLAGLYRDQLLVEETAESLAAAIRPKVQGALALHQLLESRPDCLYIAFSSTTSFFGGAMFGAYAAANRFLDNFCHWRTAQGKPTCCLGWSTWNETGMNRTVSGKEPLRATGRGFLEISPEQGIHSLLASLAHDEPHLLIGLDGSAAYIRRHVENASPLAQKMVACFTAENGNGFISGLKSLTMTDKFGTPSDAEFVQVEAIPYTPSGKVDRARLTEIGRQALRGGEEKIAPRNERERRVAQIWQDVLGVAQIGVNDNFFELGGHSLLATLVMSRLGEAFRAALPVRLLFESPTVASLTEKIAAQQTETVAQKAILPARRDGELPLSFAQQRFWFVEQLDPGTPAHNLSIAMQLTGDLNVALLERALTEIFRRQESLRTTFPDADGKPTLRIAPPSAVTLPVIPLEHLPEAERDAETLRLAAADLRTPFDLANGPLIRVQLIRQDALNHALLTVIHHIVSDGWSLGIFNEELSALYSAYLAGQPSPLPDLSLQYADYAVYQRDELQGEALETQLTYWKKRIEGVPTLLELPLDHPRPPFQTFRGTHQSFTMDAELTRKLKTLCQQEGVTLFMALMAAFQALLARYSGQEQFLVSTGIGNRSRKETEDLIGCLINILLLRADVSGEPTFRELLARVKEDSIGAYAHQDLPFEKLVEEVQPERDLSYNPLTQVMFVVLNAPAASLKLPGIQARPLDIETAAAQYDLVVHIYETPDGMAGYLDYYTDLFEADTIQRLLGHFQTLLESVVADAGQFVSRLPLLTDAERSQLVTEFNNSTVDFGTPRCLHHYFEENAGRQPNAPAILFGDEILTYGELNARSNQLAWHLQSLGVGPDVLVGLSVERSLEMVIGIIGILKAGGAYIPLDPAYPQERLTFMLEDTRTTLLLTQEHLQDRLPQENACIVRLDADWEIIAAQPTTAPPSDVTPENLTYVIYTSGSTGEPKGILIRHAGVGNNLLDLNTRFQVGPSDRIMALSSLSFDMCVYETLGALCAGAGIVMPKQEQLREPTEWASLIRRHGVTIWNTAPALLKMLLDLVEEREELWPRTLRLALMGGDWVPITLPDRLKAMAPGLRFIVMGGATEASIHSTIYEVMETNPEWRSIPYGHSMANQTTFILDANLQLVPLGIAGELHLGGVGMGRGYWNRPELTAQKFIPHPFIPGLPRDVGTRLYKTGDLARWRPDGEIELLGRMDYMVKLRGLRIELGEIEAVLRRHPAVREAVVAAKGMDTDKRLVAYVVPHAPETSADELIQELRAWVKASLPEYMTPSAFLLMEKLPLSPNGKVDRKALPVPERAEAVDKSGFVAARTPTEEILAGICAGVLNLAKVGVHDNFFEIGGHSLLATQVISRIREAFAVELPVRTLFESPTVSGLAEAVESRRNSGEKIAPPIISVPRNDNGLMPVSFAQQRLWIVDQLSSGKNASYNIPVTAHLTGALDIPALEKSLTEIIRRHEILRTTFVMERGEPMQIIAPPSPVALSVVNLTHLPDAERMPEVLRLAAEELRTPFNLAKGPLLRVTLYEMAEEEHILLIISHHIISDGWSISVFNEELAALYGAFVYGLPSPLPDLTIQYADYAVWQRDYLRGEVLDYQMAYWKTQLTDAPTKLDLPTDRPRPPVQSFRGARHTVALSPELLGEINAFSQAQGATLYMTLLAAFNVLLSRCTGADDIIVGSPIAGRTRVETENLIGFFINTLVLRTTLTDSPNFVQLLRRVRETILGATAHQEVQFDQIVEMLRPPRDRSRNPVFQVNFRVHTAPPAPLTLCGLTAQPLEELDFVTAKFDLALDITATEDGLNGYIEYNTDLFDAATIARIAEDFETTLRAVLQNPTAPLSSLDVLRSPLNRG